MTTDQTPSSLSAQALPSPKFDKTESTIRSLSTLFLLGGLLSLFFSLTHLLNSSQTDSFLLTAWYVGTNGIWGVLMLFGYWLLRKRKAAVLWLYGAYVVWGIVVSIFFGSWINLIGITVSVVVWITLFTLKKKGVLV